MWTSKFEGLFIWRVVRRVSNPPRKKDIVTETQVIHSESIKPWGGVEDGGSHVLYDEKGWNRRGSFYSDEVFGKTQTHSESGSMERAVNERIR